MTEHSINLDLAEIEARLGSHSIFAPSGSAMWAYCAGSLIPNLLKSDRAGIDAAEGTVAHGVAEKWLKEGVRPDHLIGTVERVVESDEETFEIEITTSMLEYVEEYVRWCEVLPGSHHVETRVDFSDLTPLKRQTGTADHAACTTGHLTITDLKYGKGVQVFAKDNTQGVLYAYGFFREWDWLYDFQTITIRICQPRLNHFDEWTITREQLLEWAAWLKERAFMAWCHNAERTPTEKGCLWCKIKADCTAYAVFAERLLDGVFDNLDDPITADDMNVLMHRLDDGSFELRPVNIGQLSIEHKVKLSRYRSMVEKFFKALDEDIEQRLSSGESVPGKKLVEGKSNRVFVSPEKATEELIKLGLDYEEIRPRGMIGITDAEKLLIGEGYKRKQLPDLLKPFVIKPKGKPTVADEDDPRPALVDLASDSFDNLDEDL